MTRFLVLLGLTAVAGGCAHGLSGRQVFQAEGIFVVLSVTGADGPVAGELLVVEPGAFLLDALGPDGHPARVVRVARASIAGGTAYAGTPGGRWAVTGAPLPEGTRRIARLGASGVSDGRLDLRLISRFPHGLSDPLLGALLAHRGQAAVVPLPDPSAP